MIICKRPGAENVPNETAIYLGTHNKIFVARETPKTAYLKSFDKPKKKKQFSTFPEFNDSIFPQPKSQDD